MARMIGTGSIGRAWGRSLGAVARPLAEWSTRSQLVARRNAMTACTELAVRRHERLEVQEFVDAFVRRRTAGTVVHAAVI
jgi:hypothetical protein